MLTIVLYLIKNELNYYGIKRIKKLRNQANHRRALLR